MASSKATPLAFIVLTLIWLAVVACLRAMPTPTPEPTATVTVTATATATPTPVVIVVTATPAPTATTTPTPRFVVLPPTGALTNQVAAKHGFGFTYTQVHYVPADSEVWILYGWPEKDDNVYRAVFRLVGGEWKLVETVPMETPAPTAMPTSTPELGKEVMR